MTHKVGNYEHALDRAKNPPRKRRRDRNLPQRTQAEEFSHAVRQFPRQAAQSLGTFEFATQLIERRESTMALEVLYYLLNNEGKFATYNKKFGEPLTALANYGHARQVKEILERAIKEFPENIAANHSMGSVFEALIKNGFEKTAAKLFSKIAIQAPELVAVNPDSGWIVQELIHGGEAERALNAFIVIASKHPKSFSGNTSLNKAIKAIREVDPYKIFERDKAFVVVRLCDKLDELRPRFVTPDMFRPKL